MLNLLYDFIPLLLFFIAFKMDGIYTAIVVGMIATAVQVILTRLIKKKFNKQQVITLLVFVVFGSLTLYFHNPVFIKWKPTIVFWFFAVVFLGSHFIGKKTIIQRMMESVVDEAGELPLSLWKKLNIAWTVFFMFLGGLNLYVAYFYSLEAWVDFKVYGILVLLIVFSVLQSLYISTKIPHHKKK